MKALITGGAGFIGYHLAVELLEHGYKVTLVDNFARGVKDTSLSKLEKKSDVKLCSCDLLNPKEVNNLGKDYDIIIHLAAIIGVKMVLERPYDVLKNNMELLFNVINLAKAQNALKKLVFASTSEIYAGTLAAYGMDIPTPETTNLTITPLDNPRTSYMLSKIYGEAVLQFSGLPFVIIRPHNFYGPRMGMSHVIPELLKKAYYLDSNDKLEVFSSDHKRTFCYIGDAVKMIRLLAESSETKGEAYNIGNEFPEISMRELANRILEAVGKNNQLDERPATTGSPKRRCPSMKKTKSAIGYESEVSLEEGIKLTFEWYKENIFEGTEPCAK